MDLNVSNNKEAPSPNNILTTEFALMEAAWAVSRISDEIQSVSNSTADGTLFAPNRRLGRYKYKKMINTVQDQGIGSFGEGLY